MTVFRVLDAARTPDGKNLYLSTEGSDLTIYVEERLLMSSDLHGSEEELAIVGLEPFARTTRGKKRPPLRVCVGGLGLGYTLRATLDLLDDHDEVEVVELMPAIVEWHREGPLGALANKPIDDPRTRVVIADVSAHFRAGEQERYDVILLDVDNGPEALSSRSNQWLYDGEGIRRTAALLRPGGRVVYWSAFADAKFTRRIESAGLRTDVRHVGAADRSDNDRHVLFVGDKER